MKLRFEYDLFAQLAQTHRFGKLLYCIEEGVPQSCNSRIEFC